LFAVHVVCVATAVAAVLELQQQLTLAEHTAMQRMSALERQQAWSFLSKHNECCVKWTITQVDRKVFSL
jgi:hypothetical protein